MDPEEGAAEREGEARGISDLPKHEELTLALTIHEAGDLAREGQVLDGYRCLLGGLERAQEMAEEGEEWGGVLVARYLQALLAYGKLWGVKLWQ